MKHLIILIVMFSGIFFCQEKSIKGKIVDAESRFPLSSATIKITGTEKGTTSDVEGDFKLTGNFTHNNIIQISYLGYYTKQLPINDFLSVPVLIIHLQPKIIPSQTVLVTGSIGNAGITPIAFSKINQSEIKKNYTDQDIPEFLSSLPSTTFYSENGNNLGYNYISIRGFDQRRISVSINGIPQNDPEDHNVYWLDFPDLLANTELIQVQRASGAGMIGYPSIGGSINIITTSLSNERNLELSSFLGSYNTRKYAVSYSSGLINNQYSFYTKISKTLSSGYRNSSWIDFNSYYISAVRYDKDFTTQLNFYGGPIADGLAYTGLPKFAIKDKDLRKQNFSYWETYGNNYTYTLARRPDEIENFSQPHFELLNEYDLNDNISINSALFLVLGNGFFDYDGSWSGSYSDYFRLKANGFDTNFIPTNALIRAQVDNTQYGWIPRIGIKHKNGELILGSEIRVHRSLHWGSIYYASNLPEGVTQDYRYYQFRGANNILNFFAHESYDLADKINLLGEVQIAYHKYKFYQEKYLNNEFSVSNFFINPRVGINYKFSNQLNLYGSFARVSREPRLKDYYDAAESSDGKTVPQFEKNPDGTYNFSEPLVKPETMNDLELGSNFRNENYTIGLNLFYMIFKNEIVKNGKLDRFGQPITGNVDRTIHVGLELSGDIKLNDNLEVILNGTYSKNYISKGITYIEINQGENIQPLDISNNRIGGFPDLLFNGILMFHYSGLYAKLSVKYVGKYYSDNYDKNFQYYLEKYPGIADEYNDGVEDYTDNVVDPYFLTNLFVSYECKPGFYFSSFKIYGQVNNLFNNLYAAYAIGKEFFPGAERNFLAGLQIGL